jgi:hypothetical protein
MNFQPRDAFVVVPGFAALGLAVLYGTGAVIKAGQLRGAHQNVRDTLPLVPLEQILALGIGTVITSLLWVTVLTFAVYFWVASRRPLKLGEVPPFLGFLGPGGSRLARIGFWAALGLAVLFLLATASVELFVTVAGLVVVGHALDRVQDRGRRYVVVLLAGYLFLLIAVRAGSAYFSPEPLPRATLTLHSGARQTEGTLLVSTSDAWYLARTENTFVSVPRARVTSAVVRSRKHQKEPRPPLVALSDWVRGK